jgi:4-carboxymuconolactone decarboxylase
MARIPLPGVEELTPAQRRVYDEVVAGPRGKVVGPLRAVIHWPELADHWQKLGALLRFKTELPPKLSELAILVTARAWESKFEWHAHEPIARKAGVGDEVIAAIRDGRRPALADPDEQAVYDFAAEMHATHTVSAPTYARVLERFGTLGVVQLTALLGYYTMVAMTLNAHEILPS